MDADARKRIVEEARTWLGTPYHHKGQAKGPHGGVDCGTFLHAVYGKFIQLPPQRMDYAADWALHGKGDTRYLDFFDAIFLRVPKPVYGGVAVFRFGVAYSHGGVCAEDHKIIHAYGRTKQGSVREDNLTFFRQPRVYFDFRL